MLRHLKFALAALALAPTAAPAQNDGLAALDAMVNADGAEDWAICTLASAHMNDIAISDAERALRDEESRMLSAVAVGRFMEQRGIGFTLAVDEVSAVVTARAPVYEDGSGGDLHDMGRCILSSMVSQSGEEQSERLVAAYDALPRATREAFEGAPSPTPPMPAPAAPQAAPQQTFYSAALGQGEAVGVSSYYVAPDGTLVGHWSFSGAASAMYGETAIPRVRGQGIAGSYSTRGTSHAGDYAGTLEITELAKLKGDVVTLYRMVWDGGTSTGLALWPGDTTLVSTFGGSSLGQFFRRDEGDAWELYLVTDVGGEPALSQFRFTGGQFEGSHNLLGGENVDRPLGSATFARDGAGVVRIAMPNGQTVVAVCNRVAITGC